MSWAYHLVMKRILRLTLLPALLFSSLALSSLVQGAESLPDEVRLNDGEKDQAMQQRFAAPVMAAEELEGLYLQSPIEIGAGSANELRSVKGEQLYSDEDAMRQERQRAETRNAQPVRLPPPPPPPPNMPASEPIRQL